jgi:hypothetical protein
MNSLLPKKLGEVHAFAIIGLELLERAGATADEAFGESTVTEMRDILTVQRARVADTADQGKTERTVLKLRSMMEHYIGDEWDNPIELLEWSGFYLGAAGIHWALVWGILSKESQSELASFAEAQTTQFNSWLNVATKQIAQI